MKNGAIKIKYINGIGREEIGYTTENELEEARQGVKAFIWLTDDVTDIKDGQLTVGYTTDYLDITEIYS